MARVPAASIPKAVLMRRVLAPRPSALGWSPGRSRPQHHRASVRSPRRVRARWKGPGRRHPAAAARPEWLPHHLNTSSMGCRTRPSCEGHPASAPGAFQPPPETLARLCSGAPTPFCTGQRLPISTVKPGPRGGGDGGPGGVPGPTLQLPGPWALASPGSPWGPRPPCLCSSLRVGSVQVLQ